MSVGLEQDKASRLGSHGQSSPQLNGSLFDVTAELGEKGFHIAPIRTSNDVIHFVSHDHFARLTIDPIDPSRVSTVLFSAKADNSRSESLTQLPPPQNKTEVFNTADILGSKQISLGAFILEFNTVDKEGQPKIKHRTVVYDLKTEKKEVVKVWHLDPERGIPPESEKYPTEAYFAPNEGLLAPNETSELLSESDNDKNVRYAGPTRDRYSKEAIVSEDILFFTASKDRVSMFVFDPEGNVTHRYRLKFDRGEPLTELDKDSLLTPYNELYEDNTP